MTIHLSWTNGKWGLQDFIEKLNEEMDKWVRLWTNHSTWIDCHVTVESQDFGSLGSDSRTHIRGLLFKMILMQWSAEIFWFTCKSEDLMVTRHFQNRHFQNSFLIGCKLRQRYLADVDIRFRVLRFRFYWTGSWKWRFWKRHGTGFNRETRKLKIQI